MLKRFISLLGLLILPALLLGYRRADVQRQVSREGVEDEQVVEAYDRISRWPQFRFLRSIVIAELRRRQPEGVLVDVGCGPGYLMATVARRFPHLTVIGVDIAEEMLQKAAGNLAAIGLADKVSFRQGDIRALPFEDSELDFVVSTLSLHHWSEPKQAMDEIHRVLRPGGQFLVFDVRRDSPRMLYWVIRFAQTFVVPGAIARIDEPTGSFLASYTPRELEALMSTTSFRQWGIQPGLGWLFIGGRKEG